MKSPSRSHHSRITVKDATVTQVDERYEVTVTFTFDPWDRASVYPIGYAADALMAVDTIIETGLSVLETTERETLEEELTEWGQDNSE